MRGSSGCHVRCVRTSAEGCLLTRRSGRSRRRPTLGPERGARSGADRHATATGVCSVALRRSPAEAAPAAARRAGDAAASLTQSAAMMVGAVAAIAGEPYTLTSSRRWPAMFVDLRAPVEARLQYARWPAAAVAVQPSRATQGHRRRQSAVGPATGACAGHHRSGSGARHARGRSIARTAEFTRWHTGARARRHAPHHRRRRCGALHSPP